jgi:hypothetical protein
MDDGLLGLTDGERLVLDDEFFGSVWNMHAHELLRRHEAVLARDEPMPMDAHRSGAATATGTSGDPPPRAPLAGRLVMRLLSRGAGDGR